MWYTSCLLLCHFLNLVTRIGLASRGGNILLSHRSYYRSYGQKQSSRLLLQKQVEISWNNNARYHRDVPRQKIQALLYPVVPITNPSTEFFFLIQQLNILSIKSFIKIKQNGQILISSLNEHLNVLNSLGWGKGKPGVVEEKILLDHQPQSNQDLAEFSPDLCYI